jgi:hypothetical protein
MVDSWFFTSPWKHAPYNSFTHKFNTSFIFHFYILGSTSRISTNTSAEDLQFESHPKWNSYEDFNLEHCPPPPPPSSSPSFFFVDYQTLRRLEWMIERLFIYSSKLALWRDSWARGLLCLFLLSSRIGYPPGPFWRAYEGPYQMYMQECPSLMGPVYDCTP